jgi:hypothetical protein
MPRVNSREGEVGGGGLSCRKRERSSAPADDVERSVTRAKRVVDIVRIGVDGD